jgi:hypothetical protein
MSVHVIAIISPHCGPAFPAQQHDRIPIRFACGSLKQHLILVEIEKARI